jgi:hypothetical protein
MFTTGFATRPETKGEKKLNRLSEIEAGSTILVSQSIRRAE